MLQEPERLKKPNKPINHPTNKQINPPNHPHSPPKSLAEYLSLEEINYWSRHAFFQVFMETINQELGNMF